MEIVTRGLWAGLKVLSVPIRVWYPEAEKRVSAFDPVKDNLRISMLHTRLMLRQMLPIPHQSIELPQSQMRQPTHESWCAISLAVSVALSIIMGIVLWPWGAIAIAYVTVRLHLNKVAALICAVASMPKVVPQLCVRVGRWVVHSRHIHM